MDFTLSMEQEILRNSERDFAENEIKAVAKELGEKEKFPYSSTTMEMRSRSRDICPSFAVERHCGDLG